MRRIGQSMVLGLALAGLVVSASACRKGTGAGGKGSVAGAASSALDIFPEDTAVIAGVSVGKVTSSKLWEQYSPMVLGSGEGKEGLAKLKDNCGIDPTKDVETVVIGVNGELDEKKIVFLVKGKFDEPKITKCITTMSEKSDPPKKVTAKTEGKISTYTEEGGKTIHVGWVASDTVLLVPAAMEGDKAALEAVLAGKTSAKNNKELAAVLGNVDTSNTIWAAMAVPATGKLKDSMASAASTGPQPKALWINLAYQKDLKLEVGARFASDKEAKEQVDKANKELETAKADANTGPYLKTVKAEAKGTDAVFSLSLDEKQVDELVGKLKDILPFLLMGMGGGGGGGGM
jgi:hypothetical protein